jgi:PAS domain S-box-containing protein
VKPISELTLADIMHRDVVTVSSECLLADMARQIDGHEGHVSCLVVTLEDCPAGVLTERDLLRLLHRRTGPTMPVARVMTTPVVVARETQSFHDAYVHLCLSRFRYLVVINDADEVVGVASEADFLSYLGLEFFYRSENLLSLVDRSIPMLSPETPVSEAIEIMLREKRGCVLVIKEGKPIGIFTDYDAPAILSRATDTSTVALGEVMCSHIHAVTTGTTTAKAVSQIARDRIPYLAVVDDTGHALGVVARGSLLENVRTTVNGMFSAQKVAEDRARTSERRLLATLESTPNVAVQWFDREGRVQYWNAASERFYGWKSEEALGRTLDQLILTSEAVSQFKEALYKVDSTGEVVGPVEFLTHDRWGMKRTVLSTVYSIPDDESGRLFVCTDTDITERKLIETVIEQYRDHLEESEKAFRATFNQAAVGITRVSPEGHLLEVNQRFCDIVGYARDELLQLTFQSITHPDDLDTDLGYVRKLLAGAIETYSLEKRYLRKSGEAVWINLTVALVRKTDNSPEYFISVVEDINQRKQAEAELLQYRDHLEDLVGERTSEAVRARLEAEHANQIKSMFLANMSHELRTPMHAILSFARLGLEKTAGGEVPIAKLREYFDYINQSGDRLLFLLNDLLDLSKLEAGKMILQLSRHDLRTLVQGVVGEIDVLARKKEIELNFSAIAPDLIVECDSSRISQVLHNLLSNAIKFSPASSTIRISASLTELHGRRAEDANRPGVLIKVQDEGIGIPPDELEAIFDEFVQSSKTRSKSGGTGLGLSICRSILGLHGGTIHAENNPERGSSLILTLPLNQTEKSGVTA